MTTQEIFVARGYIVLGSEFENQIGKVWPAAHCFLEEHQLSKGAVLVVAETDHADWWVQMEMTGDSLERLYVYPFYYRVIAE